VLGGAGGRLFRPPASSVAAAPVILTNGAKSVVAMGTLSVRSLRTGANAYSVSTNRGHDDGDIGASTTQEDCTAYRASPATLQAGLGPAIGARPSEPARSQGTLPLPCDVAFGCGACCRNVRVLDGVTRVTN
jgi:hypothetical protein